MANLIDKKDLKKVFWRSQICQFSHNYERMQSLSTVYILKIGRASCRERV